MRDEPAESDDATASDQATPELDYVSTTPTIPVPRRRDIFAPLWWMLQVTGILIIGGFALALVTGLSGLGALGATLMLGGIVVAGTALRSLRRRRVRPLLTYLQLATRLNLPLAPMLSAAAASEGEAIARRITRMRTELEMGRSVSDALVLAAPHTPRRTADLVASGERLNELPAVLARLLRENHGDDRRGVWSDFNLFRTYVLVMLMSMGVLFFVIDLFVFPKFIQIMKDFRLPLPMWTDWLLDYGPMLAPFVAVIPLIIVMAMAGGALRQLFSRAVPRPMPLRRLFDWFAWRTPIAGAIARNRGLADALQVAADALEAHLPVDQAIADAALPHLNSTLRRRLDRWAALLKSGTPIEQAARTAGLPNLVVGLCGSASRTAGLPAAFGFLARHYRSRFVRATELIHAAGPPVVAAFGAIVVLVMWAALYGPMMTLIQVLSMPGGRTW